MNQLYINTLSHGSEGGQQPQQIIEELYISTLSHGSEWSFSVCVVANSFDDYIN